MKRYLYWLVGIALTAFLFFTVFPYVAEKLTDAMSTVVNDSMGGME